MIQFVIAGAGGLGREVYHWVRAYASNHYGEENSTWKIRGFIDDNANALDPFSNFAPIVDSISNYIPQPEDRVVVALGKPAVRKAIAEKLSKLDIHFETIIHPSAIITPNVELGQGSIICPAAIITDNTTIGDFVLINFKASIGHDCIIGDYSELAPHVAISGLTTIGSEVFMGTGSVVAPGKNVGEKARISAGSAVMQNIPAKVFAQGVPCEAKFIIP